MALPGTRMTFVNIATEMDSPKGPSMIDIAIAAVAFVSVAIAATVAAMDYGAVERHVDDHGADHDAARSSPDLRSGSRSRRRDG